MKFTKDTLFLILAVVIFSTEVYAGIEGKYLSMVHREEYILLNDDGSFEVMQEGQKLKGKYKIDGKKIFLTFEDGIASIGYIEGQTLIDPGGEQWVKHE